MNIPSAPLPTDHTVSGKVSWFGGPRDSTDSGHTASGGTTATPGIAVYNRATLGGYWRVTDQKTGRSVVLKQTDLGPAPFTGRKIDVTYSALNRFGYNENNFPTDSDFSATYLGAKPKSTVSTATIPVAAKTVSSPQLPSLNQAAFKKAQGAAMLGKLLSQEKGSSENPLLTTGIIPTKEPSPQEYEAKPIAPATTEHHVVGGLQSSTYFPAGTHLGKLKGAVDFGDKKVAAWIAPILQYARQHGWTGTVQSGYRSLAEQTHIYDSGVRPAAKPGTSNHEFTMFPGGAVDVTAAPQLSAILAKSPYAKTLVWAGSKDPVHFSHPHNGSY